MLPRRNAEIIASFNVLRGPRRVDTGDCTFSGDSSSPCQVTVRTMANNRATPRNIGSNTSYSAMSGEYVFTWAAAGNVPAGATNDRSGHSRLRKVVTRKAAKDEAVYCILAVG